MILAGIWHTAAASFARHSKAYGTRGGRPFLDWVLGYLRQQGITDAVLSTGYLSEIIEAYYAQHPPAGMKVQCAREEFPMGTAGGFLNACARVQFEQTNSAWLVVNGDSLAIADLGPLLQLAEDAEADGGLLAVECQDASRFGTLEVDSQGWLRQFREKRSGPGLINAGVYLLKPAIVRQAEGKRPLSFETELFPAWLSAGKRLRVVPCEASFLDIGTPGTLREAESFVQANAAWFKVVASKE